MQYFRVPTGDIPVDYEGRDVLLGSCITNISTTGVFVRTNKPLPKDQTVQFVFRLPGSDQDIEATGIVRWSAEPEAAGLKQLGSTAGMGLEFTHLSRKDKKLIEKYIHDFLARMRRS